MSADNRIGKDFPTVSHRVIYSYIALFDDFHPAEDIGVSPEAQRQMYDFLCGIMQTLYENPSLLALPDAPDECEDRPADGKNYLDTRKIMRGITKKIEDLLTLLHAAGKSGTVEADALCVNHKELRLTKSKCGTLGRLGLEYEFRGDICALRHPSFPALAGAWCSLARRTDSLHLFSHAVFGDPDVYAYSLLRKLLRENHPHLLPALDRFRELGYRFVWSANKTAEICGFKFVKKVSGFDIHFDRRFYRQLDFSIVNHINYKAMLEDFEKQSDTLQAFMAEVSRKCSRCGKCTKGNPKTALFCREITFRGETYMLCPSFPRFGWKEIPEGMMENIIECIETQERYG